MLKYVDAFCGMGGFSVAAHDFDAECVFAIENNKHAQKTFESNFSVVPFGDITTLDFSIVPDHDILFGGFPCQPFSRAGKWYNKNNKTVNEDARTNLVLNLIGLLRYKMPKYFVFENVKELTKIKNENGDLFINIIVEELEQSGYKVQHKVLNSKNFGVPQSRERVYFVGIRDDLDSTFIFPEPSSNLCGIDSILEGGNMTKYSWETLRAKYAILDNEREPKKFKNHPYPKGTSRNLVFKYLLENAKNKVDKNTGKIELLCSLFGDTPSGQTRQQDRVYSVKGISPTVTAMLVPSIYDGNMIRELSPREVARVQGFPDAFKLHDNNKIAYRQLGNAVTVPVVKAILKNLIKENK